MLAPGVTRRGGAVVLALIVAACSSSDPEAATTTSGASTTTDSTTTTTMAPAREASTTTTGFDPASVEGQVEAAYLKSWDVYADAVYNLELDQAALAEVYAGEALALRTTEIERRIGERRSSLVRLDHDYQVVVSGTSTANVVDDAVNHQVLIDADSKVPTEPDPDERLIVNFKIELIDGTWRVTFIQKVTT